MKHEDGLEYKGWRMKMNRNIKNEGWRYVDWSNFLTIYYFSIFIVLQKILGQNTEIITFRIQSPLALINFKKEVLQNHFFLAREKTGAITEPPSIFSTHGVHSGVRREWGWRDHIPGGRGRGFEEEWTPLLHLFQYR